MKMGMRAALLPMMLVAQPGFAADEPINGPVARAEVARAERIAGSDLRQPLFLCAPGGGGVVRHTLETQSSVWIEPTRAFDNLFFVGNGFVGVWVLKTSEGLILFDATQSEADARDHLVPGLQALGLDPKTIRYVIVTHGHWDHFGGAAWLQKTYGARIGLSKADWDLIERTPESAQEINSRPRPRHDLEIVEGDVIRLGDSSVTFHVTPGHTPGTVSAIVPVREKGRTYNLSLLGSTAFPQTAEPTPLTGGLRAYDTSVQRFARISADAKAQGLLNTHIFADGTSDRLAAARVRGKGAPNPFLTGPAFTARYYQILHHCLLAAEARLAPDTAR